VLPFHEFCGSDEQWSQQSKLIRLLFDCLFSPAAAVAKFGAVRVGKFGCLTRGREMSGWPVRDIETCERQELSSSNVMARIDSCGEFQIYFLVCRVQSLVLLLHLVLEAALHA